MAKINLTSFRDFFASKSAGGILLLVCVMISLVIANTAAGPRFEALLATEAGPRTSTFSLRYPLLLWINDGLMAVFFLLVGLEIKRELLQGELSSVKRASLPVIAAVGGMVVPALIFSIFNLRTPTAPGWGIPMATDIAFAIAIISLLGNKVPLSLKVFLTALAIVDDLGAIVVIAIFYSGGIQANYLGYAFATLLLPVIFNRLGVRNIFAYILPGLFMWYFIHHSGIHATIAGVLTAFTIPANATGTASPLEKLEHVLNKPVNFIIMPLFALANTNIRFEAAMLTGLWSNMGLGIFFGLVAGKPLGIFGMSWLAVRLRIGSMPLHATWKQLFSLGILGGIGFTMSIFVAMLSYGEASRQAEAKFVILVSSVTAALLGYFALVNTGKKS
jgi:Na+:H+ antiporter, NhaA family